MYVKPTVRTGLLARMLRELLDTRVMVKQGMKITKDDKVCNIFICSFDMFFEHLSAGPQPSFEC